jgi:RHS repeat-associated protein
MKSFILKSLIAFSLFFLSAKSFANEANNTTPSVTIHGPTSVETGSTITFTVTTQNINVTSSSWNITGTGSGNIISQDNSSATVYFTGTGNIKLDYTVTSANPAITGTVKDVLNITVTGAVAPSAPATPSVENIGCNTADLVAGGVPPTNVQWYWQGTNISGTSTANPAYAEYPVTANGTYYIRAMNVNTNLWSFSSTPVTVTLGTPTWYQDSDGDGLGDPNLSLSITACSQPAGYVSNDLDQCPTVNGQGSETGCQVSISLSNENYVYSITPRVRVTDVNQLSTDNDALRNVTYFDGRGRKMQSVAIRQSPNKKDIVAYHEYDPAGREAKTYLPYQATDNTGAIKVDPKEAILQHYQTHYANDFVGSYADEINPYSEVTFEEHALSRPTLQAAPGHDWKLDNGHEVKMEYALNTSYDAVKLFDVTLDSNFNPTLSLGIGLQTTYADGKLTKNIVKDENWTLADGVNKTTEEFKNMRGQVVLKRNYDNGQAHDTYYVYDDFGNLSFVLPPKASDLTINTTVLDELCYQYKYDHRNRIVEKKIPGKGWEYIVYDKLDRPVLVQDAVQRQSNKWLYTKYDKLGRVAYSGEYTNTSVTGQASMQSTFDANNDLPSELYENMAASQSNLNINYDNNNFPNSNIEVFTVNYYDTYYELPTGFTPPTSVYGQTITTNTQGLATVSKVRVLGTNDWITSFTYYDEKNRPVYIYSKNDYLQTTDIIETHLDFTGKVLETTTTHQKQGQNAIVTIDRFEYDAQDRLVSQTQKIGNQTPERIVRNHYDELGQLTGKLTGNGTEKGYTDITTNISINNDVISKTSGSCWYEGLATKGSFDEDGYVEYEVGTTTFFMVGLSDTNTNPVWTTIDYAIYNEGTNIVIYENASHKGYHEVSAVGDIFRIERIGNKIYYKKNGATFYTSQTLSTGTLLGDVSICADGTQIKGLHIVDNSKGLQNVDFDYNVRGWMTDINNVDAVNSDLFTFKINYNDPTSGTALFNGNISQTHWNTANSDISTKTYTYGYDALNRIKSGTFTSTNASQNGRYDLSAVNYDKNGNITLLTRKGHTNSAATNFGTMDNIYYSYVSGGNKLRSTYDSSGVSFGYKDVMSSGDDYTYDENGNMKTDANKGITGINYNHLNLPTRVFFNGNQYIDYKYDAAGTKLEKRVVDHSNVTTTYYAGNHVYEKVNSGNTNLQFFSHSEGYYNVTNPPTSGELEGAYVYQYKDHLGNVRLSYTDADGDGVISDVFFADDLESASGWDSTGALNGYAAEYDTSIVHSGNYSGKIVNTASSERFVHSNQWLPINNAQATSYTFSGWLYSNGPSSEIFLFMNEENETGYFTQVQQVSTSTTGQWVYVEKTVSVPANIRYLNIRVDNNGTGTVWFDDIRIQKGASEIIEESNYYPFGLKQKGYNNAISANGNALAQRKKFGGFELQDELNLQWYDMTARNYDPALGRWMNLDPLAEQMRRHSPYNYAFNNPIFFIDPDGMAPTGNYGQSLENSAVSWASNNAADWEYSYEGEKVSRLANGNLVDSSGNNITVEGRNLNVRYDGAIGLNGATNNCCNQPGAVDNGDGTMTITTMGQKIIMPYNPDKEPVIFRNSVQNNMSALSTSIMLLGQALKISVFAAGLDSYTKLKNGFFLASNGKVYSMRYYGNQWVSRYSVGLDKVNSNVLKGFGTWMTRVGRFLGVSSILVGQYEYELAIRNGDNNAAEVARFKQLINTIGLRGGPIGWGVWIGGQLSLVLNPTLRPVEPYEPNWERSCFVAGTKILMYDGSEKNIEDIQIGDRILSVNINTMEIEEDIVMDLPTIPKEYEIIEGKFENGTVNLFSPTHPYWVKGKGWSVYNKDNAETMIEKNASLLRVGDIVLYYKNGVLKETKVLSLESKNEYINMFNVQFVKKNNNFFANGILVHNRYIN